MLHYKLKEGDGMSIRPNHDLRIYAADAGVFMWQVAKAYDTTYNTLNNWMRHEFDENKKAEFKAKVDKIVNKEA